MTTIKNVQVPSGFHMVSFDVKSLFTNVSLEYTIGLVQELKMFISATIMISTYIEMVLLWVPL